MRTVAEWKDTMLRLLRTECAGRDNAMTAGVMAERLGLRGARQVRRLIEHLRADGWLVGTSRGGEHAGAFWPVTTEDQKEALLGFEHAWYRMTQIRNRLRQGLPRNVVDAVTDQVQLELFEEHGYSLTGDNDGSEKAAAGDDAGQLERR